MFLRELLLAFLVSSWLAATAPSTEPRTDATPTGSPARTDPGGWSQGQGRKNDYREERTRQGHWNLRRERTLINEEDGDEWRRGKHAWRSIEDEWKKGERGDEVWKKERKGERNGSNNPMKMAWGRLEERGEEEAKRSNANESERREGMLDKEEETRWNAEERPNVMKERPNKEERTKNGLEYEEGRGDGERETDGEDALWRQRMREERRKKQPINKTPAEKDTFIQKEKDDNRNRMHVAAKERQEDKLWREEMEEGVRRTGDRENRTNKPPVTTTKEETFPHKEDEEKLNTAERKKEEKLNTGEIRHKVSNIEHVGDERKERKERKVGEMEMTMRRNKRTREETGQREERHGNREILRTERRANGELRMETRRGKGDDRLRGEGRDEKERHSDRREKKLERRDKKREIRRRVKEAMREEKKEKEQKKEKVRKEIQKIVKEIVEKEMKEKESKKGNETKVGDEEKVEEKAHNLAKVEDKKENEPRNETKREEKDGEMEEVETEKAGKETEKRAEPEKVEKKREDSEEKHQNQTKVEVKEEEKTKDEIDEEESETDALDEREDEEEEKDIKEEVKRTLAILQQQEEEKTSKMKTENKNKTNDTKPEEKKTGLKTKDIENEMKTGKVEKDATGNMNETNKGKVEEEIEIEEGTGIEAAVSFLLALKEKGEGKNAREKLLTMQGVKGKQGEAINISNTEDWKEKTPDKDWNRTKVGKEKRERKKNKARTNETREKSKHHEGKDKGTREVMLLKAMKKELEQQIRRKEKQEQNKLEYEQGESEITKIGMGIRNDNQTLGIPERYFTKEENETKDNEEKTKLSQNKALKEAIRNTLRKWKMQEEDENQKEKEKEENKEKENWEIKPRKYNIEKNSKNWIGDKNVDEMEKGEGKEEIRKKRKKRKEKIRKSIFKLLAGDEKIEGQEKTGEGQFNSSVLRSEPLKSLRVNLDNRTWKEKERKLIGANRKEAEERQREAERKQKGVGIEKNEEKKRLRGENQTRIGYNKTDDNKTPEKKSVEKTINETKIKSQNVTKEKDAKETTIENFHPPIGTFSNTQESVTESPIYHLFPPSLVVTHNSSSPMYLLPTWECALSLIGVKADSHVAIVFQRESSETASIILHLQRQWTPEEIENANSTEAGEPGDVGEALLEVTAPGDDSTDVVAREEVRLRTHVWTFLSVFRGDRVFAVFRAGQQLPFLVYVTPSRSKTFISDLKLVKVWSKGDAEWDLLGDNYLGENGGREPKDLAIRRELQEVRDGLTSRLGVAAVLREYGWRPEDDDPRLMKYNKLRESLATLRPLKTLLLYYGRVGSLNDSWHDDAKVKGFVANMDIDSVLCLTQTDLTMHRQTHS